MVITDWLACILNTLGALLQPPLQNQMFIAVLDNINQKHTISSDRASGPVEAHSG